MVRVTHLAAGQLAPDDTYDGSEDTSHLRGTNHKRLSALMVESDNVGDVMRWGLEEVGKEWKRDRERGRRMVDLRGEMVGLWLALVASTH